MRSLINRIYKRQATLCGQVMRKQKLEHPVTSGMSEGKQHEKMLDGLTKWLKVGRMNEALKARRDRDGRSWPPMLKSTTPD